MSEKSISVLLIEDNPADARLIRELLDEDPAEAFEVAHATELETGLDRLAQKDIDVVLLDLSLPDSHGIDTFHHVNTHSPHVPIVVLTGLKDDAIAAQTLHAGGQDFPNKGLLNLSVLRQTLRHAVDRKKAEILHDTQHTVARDQYVAVLSYKLRRPLTSLLSTVSALRHAPTTNAELVPALDMIRSQVETQGRLIDDILEYSRIGTTRAELQPTECEAVFECALINLSKAIDEAGAAITHDSLPHVWADGTQMVQLVQNLIGNAIEYRGDAPPRIHVAARRQGDEWVFSIRDNGIGFDPKHADRIFGIFQRLQEGDEHVGSGIGLAICKRIVERHAGRIWAESEPGRGSTFFFTIPVRENHER